MKINYIQAIFSNLTKKLRKDLWRYYWAKFTSFNSQNSCIYMDKTDRFS